MLKGGDRRSEKLSQTLEFGIQEVEVLEKDQYRQVDENTDTQPQLSGPGFSRISDFDTCLVIKYCTEQKQWHIQKVMVTIEYVATNQ